MGLNIKNEEVERLATEVARKFGESKTEAIRVALEERLERAEHQETIEERLARVQHVLETQVWPKFAPDGVSKPMSKVEREEILGYGPDGY